MRSKLLGLLAGAVMALPLAAQMAQAENVKVAITTIVEHPSLNAARDGVKDALAEAGFVEGENLTWLYQSALNSQATAVQIAQQFVGEDVDVFVAVGTPSAQAAANATSDIPIVFAAVTDPVSAGLVADMAHPEANVTGISDMTPVADHVSLMREMLPDGKKIGYIYNPSEANSVAALELLKQEAAAKGFEVVEAPAMQTSMVQTAANSLVGNVDAIYITTDNTVVSALEPALRVAEDNKIPFFSADPDSVERGALAALGFNYYDLGKQTGAVVVEILQGKTPAEIPARIASGNDLVINLGTAEAIGIEISQDILDRATKIIE